MRNANAQRIIRKNTASPIGRLGQALSDYPPPRCRCRSRAQAADATPVKAHRSGGRRKRGDFAQAIGRSRDGRTTKLHGLADDQGRPRGLLLSSGNTNDISLAASHRKKCRRLEQELY
jgi:hypothetical protein